MKAPKPVMTPTEFIRSMPEDMPPREVWEAAQAEGINFSDSLVTATRHYDRKRAALGKPVKPKGAKDAEPEAPKKRKKRGPRPPEGETMVAKLHSFLWYHQVEFGHAPPGGVNEINRELKFYKDPGRIRTDLARLRDKHIITMAPKHYETIRVVQPPPGPQLVAEEQTHDLARALKGVGKMVAHRAIVNGVSSWVDPPALPEMSESSKLISDLEAAGRRLVGSKGMAGEDVKETAQAFQKVIEILKGS